MRAESAEGLMHLKERTKQFELRVIRMHSALPKNPEAQVIGRQVLCSGTLVDVHSRQGRYSIRENIVELGIQDAPSMVTSLTRQTTAHQRMYPPVRRLAGAGPTETSWHHQCDGPAHQ
jgi:hypothetical protein